MGQRVTSTDPWPTWPTQICWPIVISGPKTRGNEDDSRYLHVFLADRGDSFIIIIIIIIFFWPRYSIPEERKNYAMQCKKKVLRSV